MSFVDMREWITRLDTEGELRRIKAEVVWDRELGAIARRVLEKKGPALLFERIKGYETGRCTKLFISGLGSVGRLALALGFPKDVSNRDLVQHVMKLNRQAIPPKTVATRGRWLAWSAGIRSCLSWLPRRSRPASASGT